MSQRRGPCSRLKQCSKASTRPPIRPGDFPRVSLTSQGRNVGFCRESYFDRVLQSHCLLFKAQPPKTQVTCCLRGRLLNRRRDKFDSEIHRTGAYSAIIGRQRPCLIVGGPCLRLFFPGGAVLYLSGKACPSKRRAAKAPCRSDFGAALQ